MIPRNARTRNCLPPDRPAHSMLFEKRTYLAIIFSVLPNKRIYFQCAHVQLVESRLHRCHIYFIGRIGKMPCRTGQPPRHLRRRHNAHIPLGINNVRSDYQLIALTVDHSVRRSATHGTRQDFPRKIGSDPIELVARADGTMRTVGYDPKITCPWNHRACAAFALIIVHGQMRIYAAY